MDLMRRLLLVTVAIWLLAACGDDSSTTTAAGPSTTAGTSTTAAPSTTSAPVVTADPSAVAGATAVIDNPYIFLPVGLHTVHRGTEDGAATRVVTDVPDRTIPVDGIDVRVVEVAEYEDGELVERTEDYYAQGTDGTVFYMGEMVDSYEDGQVVDHEGGWLAGEDGALPGVFMPAEPAVGDGFDQEQAPGVAEDHSDVVDVGVSVTVPAGSYDDCIETEDTDPLGDDVEHKIYCRGVGLVQELYASDESLDLVEISP